MTNNLNMAHLQSLPRTERESQSTRVTAAMADAGLLSLMSLEWLLHRNRLCFAALAAKWPHTPTTPHGPSGGAKRAAANSPYGGGGGAAVFDEGGGYVDAAGAGSPAMYGTLTLTRIGAYPCIRKVFWQHSDAHGMEQSSPSAF